jgi:4-alpha-glucanotransferase
LPGPFGIGEIGVEAFAFIDRLVEMEQALWQILPMGPTGYGDSPYQVHSSFACNDLLICFRSLLADKLLDAADLENFPSFPEKQVDFGAVIPARKNLLAQVAEQFAQRASTDLKQAFAQFCDTEASWLEDYALYRALKEHFDLAPWYEWPEALRTRDSQALNDARASHAHEIQTICIRQFLFDRQWSALRAYAGKHGVQLIGDIPIFVAHDSADVWADPQLFYMDEAGMPTKVAGVPPDYFSADGQLWGNPLYKWDLHEADNYAWWIKRLKRSLSIVDILRIDHFRGFEQYWAVPFGETTAINGGWEPGPDHKFFSSILEQLGELPIIAEDLGLITDAVDKLRDDFHLPGMRVMHFCLGDDQPAHLHPDGFPENSVVYTGTHDNDTTVGWMAGQTPAERKRLLARIGSDGKEINWDLAALVFNTAPRTAILPMQDILGLGSEARMNEPGTTQGNWQWRMAWSELNAENTRKTVKITKDSHRNRFAE